MPVAPRLAWMCLLLVPLSWSSCACRPTSTALSEPCRALLLAAPAAWTERLAPVHAGGHAASALLLPMLRERPEAPGAPAATALLGRLGGDGVVAFLVEQMNDRSPVATEAALALGELRATAAQPDLLACVHDHLADPTLRTAAACALVRVGAATAASPLLHAVLLAGTPAGTSLASAQGLPDRPRWALERYLVQRLLLSEGAIDLATELDPDASWPRLEAVTARVMQWLASR